MKFPAVAIDASFACGILLNELRFGSQHSGSPKYLVLVLAAVLCGLILGLVLRTCSHDFRATAACRHTIVYLLGGTRLSGRLPCAATPPGDSR